MGHYIRWKDIISLLLSLWVSLHNDHNVLLLYGLLQALIERLAQGKLKLGVASSRKKPSFLNELFVWIRWIVPYSYLLCDLDYEVQLPTTVVHIRFLLSLLSGGVNMIRHRYIRLKGETSILKK